MTWKRTLLIWESILAGAQVFVGASTLGDIIPLSDREVGLLVLVVGAVQVATATFKHGLYSDNPSKPNGGTS